MPRPRLPRTVGPRRPRRARARRVPPLPAIYQVVVQCCSERDQRRVYQQMTAAGRQCRVLTL